MFNLSETINQNHLSVDYKQTIIEMIIFSDITHSNRDSFLEVTDPRIPLYLCIALIQIALLVCSPKTYILNIIY